MKLSENGLKNIREWTDKGYILPEFDREEARKKTVEAPVWVHFGIGNIFRAFQCNVVQRLLNSGDMDRGITAIEGYDYEIVDRVCRDYDDYSILVTLKSDGNVEKTVIGSVLESLKLDSNDEEAFSRVKEVFSSASLQMASFTITEKGYSLTDANGEFLKMVEDDFKAGPEKAGGYMGKVAALLYTRFKNGELPIAMVSMDNCSHNGDKLFAAIREFALKWENAGLADKGFADYVSNPKKVSFPWSMIDKITPRPDPSVTEILKKDGVEGAEPVVTGKNTFVAPFVNAEECEYLVIEDSFPNGRPPLEKAGVMFTDKETVDKVEKMKVCTCLNPLHTALAVYGCLMGYTLIADEMKNPLLKGLAEGIGYTEGLPVVVNPGILNPEEFINTVVNVRIPNPFMPDTPQRIATDTSQKLSVRFGETVKAYIKTGRSLSDLKLIPLVYAGWIRYIMAVDDKGNSFELSSDPLFPEVLKFVKDIKLGDTVEEKQLEELYRNEKIFGVDLCETGLSGIVTKYFNELIAGEGAVEETLKKYV